MEDEARKREEEYESGSYSSDSRDSDNDGDRPAPRGKSADESDLSGHLTTHRPFLRPAGRLRRSPSSRSGRRRRAISTSTASGRATAASRDRRRCLPTSTGHVAGPCCPCIVRSHDRTHSR